MIASLRGTLLSKRPEGIVVEVGGVGYQVHVPLGTLASLPEEGAAVSLSIYTHVREDALSLYGFPSDRDRKVFTTLLGISGIGPKVALNILSGIPADKLIEAIEREDTVLLHSIPGVGKKTANRLILELKEKLPTASDKRDLVYDDALSALINLGYNKKHAAEALEKVYRPGQHGIETLLREALKYLTNE